MKQLLRSIRALLIASLIIFALIFFGFPPNRNDVILLGGFFGSLFLVISCSGALTLYRLRIRLAKGEVVYAALAPSVRSGLLIGLGVTFSLILNFLQILTPWNFLLIASILLLVELYFKSAK